MKSSDMLSIGRKLETAGWTRHDLRKLHGANRTTLIALRQSLRDITCRRPQEPPTGMTPIHECGLPDEMADTLAGAGFVVLGDLLVLSPIDLSCRKHPKVTKRFAKDVKGQLLRLELSLSDAREQISVRLSRIFGGIAETPVSTVISLANLPPGGTGTSDATIKWAKEHLESERVLTAGEFILRSPDELFGIKKGGTISEVSRLLDASRTFRLVRKQIGPLAS